MSDTNKVKIDSALEPGQVFSSSDDELKEETNEPEKASKNGLELNQENKISSEESKIEENDEVELKKKLSKVEEESKKNFETMLRAKAELENYKKRTNREMQDLRKYATEALIREFLTIVDNLERAVDSFKNSSDGTLEGIELTLNEMVKLLRKYNVTPLDSVGISFNPEIHQAMSQEETSDHPKNTVVREFLKGYLLHDRLLRPAMVAVSKKPEKKDS